MKKIILSTIIIIALFLIGCTSTILESDKQISKDSTSGYEYKNQSIIKYTCPSGEEISNTYECNNYEHIFHIEENLDCNNSLNFEKTGLRIMNPVEPPKEIPFYHSGYIRTKWYPSLNEGNIEILSQYLENTGCTILNNKKIGITYIVTEINTSSNKKIVNFPSGQLFYSSGKDEIYPGNFDLFKIVLFEDFESEKTDLHKFSNPGPYLITTIFDYDYEVILKEEFEIMIE